jgi:putative membrane protein
MKHLILVLKGMAYGLTHVLPGLGGGMVLILMGIYEQFVDVMGNLVIQRHRWREFLAFLIPLGIGMCIGVVVTAKVLANVLEQYPAATNVFFMGLLIGTVPSILRLHGEMKPTAGRIAAAIIGLLLVASLKTLETYLAGQGQKLTLDSFAQPRVLAYNTLVSFLGGGASVTPGLDGSLVLILGGTYEPILNAFGDLVLLTIHWGPLLTTGAGAVTGILVFSKLIDLLIKAKPSLAYYAVLGLILGSVYILWPRQPSAFSLPLLVLIGVVGAGLALWLGGDSHGSKPAAQTKPL